MGYMDDLFMTGNLTTSTTQNQKQEYNGKPKDGDRADLDVELEDENRKAEMSPENRNVYTTPVKGSKIITTRLVYRRLRGGMINGHSAPDFSTAYIFNIGDPVPYGHIFKAESFSFYSSPPITAVSLTVNCDGIYSTSMMNQLVGSSNLNNNVFSMCLNPPLIFQSGDQMQAVCISNSGIGTAYALVQIQDVTMNDM